MTLKTPRFNRVFSNKRFNIILRIFSFLFAIIILRVLFLNFFVSHSKKLQRMGQKQYETYDTIKEFRGSILDRKGQPLALSITRPSIAINPKVFKPSKKELEKISKILQIKQKSIEQIRNKKSYFSWLKRQVPYNIADDLKAMNINGMSFILEPFRYYPLGEAASNLVGYVGTDHSGLFGLEALFDKFLKPQKTDYLVSKDGRGKTLITSSKESIYDVTGYEIKLTIDSVIQEIASEVLKEWVSKSQAKGGFILVADPYSGKLLAVANEPSFDANLQSIFSLQKTQNLGFTQKFEPGSVIKPIVYALAIEQKATTPTSLHDCESGTYKVDKKLSIHDTHPRGISSTTEALMHSSNICTYKIAKLLTPEKMYSGLLNFGFSQKNPYDPKDLFAIKQLKTYVPHFDKWTPIQFSNLSFGQGFFTTGLEMLTAYNILANGGRLVKPRIIEKVTSRSGKPIYQNEVPSHQVLTQETAYTLRQMLAQVVLKGGGRNAFLKEYTTAGKTGTTEKFDLLLKQYSKDKRIASFIGFAPVDDPYLTVYVVIDEPKLKPYYGGTWAAPAFAQVVQRTLKYLNIPTSPLVSSIETNKPL